jgi:hypothetical protein
VRTNAQGKKYFFFFYYSVDDSRSIHSSSPLYSGFPNLHELFPLEFLPLRNGMQERASAHRPEKWTKFSDESYGRKLEA